MKKILSILICLVLGISSAWAQDCSNELPSTTTTSDTEPSTNYGLVVQLAIEGRGRAGLGSETAYKSSWGNKTFDEGKVTWVEKTSDVESSVYFYDYEQVHYTRENTGSWLRPVYTYTIYEYANQKFYFYAQATQPGYYFSNWAWDAGTMNENHAKKNSDASEGNGNNGHITEFSMMQLHDGGYYDNPTAYPCNIPVMKAVFAPVTVNSATDGVVEVNDINSTVTGTVSFSVSGADDINDFETPIVTGTDFSYVSMSYNNNVVTVTVQYTSQTTDNVNGDPKPEFSANVTLTSKGGEAGAANKTQTAKIKANVSLKPTFDVNPTSYDFFNEYGIIANSESKTKTLTVTTTNKAAAASAYTYSLSNAVSGSTTFSGASNPYTIDPSNPLQPVVKFTAPANGYYEDIQCTLTVYCTYTDAQSKQIVSETKTVTLTADAGSAIKINNTQNASHNFGTTIYGTGASTSLPFTATVAYTEAWDPSSTFTHSISGDKITVNVPADAVPGDYSSTLNFTYDGDVVATLAVSAQVRLAKPVLTATGGLGNAIQLNWTAVHGATKYIVKSGATEVVIIGDDEVLANTYKVTSIGATPIKLGQEYAFTVTAIYDTENPYGTIVSDEVRVAASVHSTITSSTVLDIYTGTEKAGAYPYHKDGKRLVDLSAAFKDNKAIFDQLFIFGLTTGDASNNITVPTATTNSNAVTPCYIYNKSGDNYVLDQTIENVNDATRPSAFNITASGQKIYFTGYAPYASCGYTWEENGVFYIKGSKNIDIYLNDCELYARHKTDVGNYPKTKTFEVNQDNVTSYLDMDEFELDITWIPFKFKGINVYSQGSGAAFCFYPNTNNFCANVHLSGENVLQSARGMDVHVNVSVGLNMDNTADQHSAPIQVVHDKNSKSRSTTLTIDDKWISGERTNGVLDLARIDYRPAPTIDLGNEKTTLIFDGGQIFLSNSFNTSSTYSVSYAISYRYYSIKDGMAKMYGLGSDQPGGTVLFKDGTIECKPLSDAVINANETAKAIFKNLFHNASSMKCPANTKIDGGTFNCDVLACNSSTSKGGSPTNSNGSPLCMVDIPVKTQLANGLVETLIDDWMNYAAQLPDGANTNNLSYYGIKSMNPEQITDENGDPLPVVHMMLPSDNICFKEEITKHWVMCYPKLSITTNQGLEAGGELGGDKPVPFSIQTDPDTKLVTIEKTSKFLFASMDDITINAVSTYSAPGNSTDIKLLEGGNPANITNDEEYVIYDKVYMLMPLVANEWKLFSPPFDISNVYVIESYPENKLIEKFSNGATDKKGNPIITGSKIAEAREAQSHRMLDMLYHWIWENDATGGNSDVWSNDKKYPAMGSLYSVGTFMQYWYAMYDDSERPIIEQLYHYKSKNEGYPTGKSKWDANFYLYEVNGESWGIDENGLQTSWKEVPTISTPRDIKGTNKVIMQKGHVYSMSFPYTIVNSQIHNPATVWDYWTGKYILLEGYPSAEATIDSDGDRKLDSRGQKIAGYNAMSDIMTEYIEPGKAVVRGNYTFSSDEVSSENIFVINGNNENKYQTAYAHNVFVNYETAWLYPAECFVYANAPATLSGMPRRITSINPQSGEITYRDETTTSTPTIAGNNQMFVYNIAGGVGIVPVVAQQVSIYNAAGQLVTSEYLTDEVHIPLPSGIYLIAGAQDQFKAVVK